jgi:hypothetical protein
MDNPRASQAFEQCLASPAKEVRESATMVYFSRPRGPEALPLAMSFLESDADINRKRMLIYNLLASSPAIFETLKKDVDTLSSEDVRQTIRKTGSAGTLQAAPAGGGIIQVGGSGTTGGT